MKSVDEANGFLLNRAKKENPKNSQKMSNKISLHPDNFFASKEESKPEKNFQLSFTEPKITGLGAI